MKYRFKTRPYKHQVRGLKRALRQGHIGLLWEPGTGKSKTIIDWAGALWTMGKLQRVLIVSPLSVVGVWGDEFFEHLPNNIGIEIVELEPKMKAIEFDYSGVLQVVVVNYDLAWRRKPLIYRFNPQMVIADESHRIKRPGAKRSWFMRSFNDRPYRAILTGTPTPKSLLDLYGQWVFLNPKRFGTSKEAYEDRYVIYGGFMRMEIRGYRNVRELKRKVGADAMAVKKDHVLDLPDRVHQRIPVELENFAWKMYERMAFELFVELDDGEVVDAKTVGVKLLKLQQITGGWIFDENREPHQVSMAKAKVYADLLQDLIEEGRKVVTFARFRPEVADLLRISRKLKIPVFAYHGGTPQKVRDERRKKFQSTKGPAVFVAQVQTGGLGITLHAASDAIFYSTTWALDDFIQACDRLHRIGQKNKVTYRHLVARKTVDLDIYAALRKKRNVTELILGDPSILTREIEEAYNG